MVTESSNSAACPICDAPYDPRNLDHVLNHMLAKGLVTKTQDGKFKITTLGHAKAQAVIRDLPKDSGY